MTDFRPDPNAPSLEFTPYPQQAPDACRTTRHCADHGWCHRCAPEFAAVMSRVNTEIQRTDSDERHWGPLYAAVAEALRAPASAAVVPAADRAALRELVAEVLWPLTDWDGDQLNAERAADAVLAVLPAPADRAAVRAEAFAEAAAAVAADTGFHIRYGAAIDYATHYAALLRRKAAEAAVPVVGGAADTTPAGRSDIGTEFVQQIDRAAELPAPLAVFAERVATAEEAGPDDVLADAVGLLLEAAGLYDGQGQPERAALLRRLAREAAPDNTETVHACPPDGSGITPCCGRTPFELPRTDRISSEPDAVTCRQRCAHCGRPVRQVTGTLNAWWVHDPDGHTACHPEHAAASTRAEPGPVVPAQPGNDTKTPKEA